MITVAKENNLHSSLLFSSFLYEFSFLLLSLFFFIPCMHECVAGAAQQQHLRSYNLYAEKGDEWACWLPGAIVLFVILNKIHCSLLFAFNIHPNLEAASSHIHSSNSETFKCCCTILNSKINFHAVTYMTLVSIHFKPHKNVSTAAKFNSIFHPI